jgi:hypothetical protein
MRNKKILKQAKERARYKALSLVNKIIKASKLNLTKEVDCPVALISIYALLVT